MELISGEACGWLGFFLSSKSHNNWLLRTEPELNLVCLSSSRRERARARNPPHTLHTATDSFQPTFDFGPIINEAARVPWA